MNVSATELSGVIGMKIFGLFSCYCFNVITDLKNRLKKIFSPFSGFGGSSVNLRKSGDVEEFKEIIQAYPLLVNEVRAFFFVIFSFLCFFLF
jgi:hypothetical protein